MAERIKHLGQSRKFLGGMLESADAPRARSIGATTPYANLSKLRLRPSPVRGSKVGDSSGNYQKFCTRQGTHFSDLSWKWSTGTP